MAEFPLDPQLAKTLLASETYGVSDQVRASVCLKSIILFNDTFIHKASASEVCAASFN